MTSKWFGAIVILAIASLILGWIFGHSKIDSMQDDIRAALDAKSYQNIKVDMSGNVATLSGEAASETAKAEALSIAENTECSACKSKRQWHVVKDKMSLQSLPVENPYTFKGEKDASGNVTVSGFVPSEQDRVDILASANRIFGSKVIDRKVTVAAGAPDAKFVDVTESYMKELAVLDRGNFAQENYNGLLEGSASNVAIRDRINAAGKALPSKYASGFRANISVPKPAAPGKVETVDECQTLFAEVKGDKKIFFESSKANIKGAESYNLLNKIAVAANRCSSFRITIGGHTDSQGSEAYNQGLSDARAAAVKNYLTSQKVEADRLTAIGYGESNPVATNATPAGRAQNRRITFTVTQAQ